MDHFWVNVFDYFKERRLAGMCYSLLLLVGGLILVVAILCQLLGQYSIYLLLAAGVVLLAWTVRIILRTRARLRERYRIGTMSCDELNKARLRLRRGKR